LEKVVIPPLTKTDEVFKIEGRGNDSIYKHGDSGDLLVRLNVIKEDLDREGINVVSELYVNVSEAILGSTQQIYTLRGEHKKISLREGT
jgi:DnaJ-class molecular chaperone